VDEKCVATLCPLSFILVFFSSSLFSGLPRREKEKEKEKPVQPFVRPRTLLAKFGLTTG